MYLIINLLVSFVGLVMIQNGDLNGYQNGAIYPYLLYLLCFYISYKYLGLRSRLNIKKLSFEQLKYDSEQSSPNLFIEKMRKQRRVNIRIFVALFILLAIVMFAFNGLNVLLGNMHKGEFRSQLGYWGFALAIPIKFLFPAFFARVCFGYYHNIRLYNRPKFNIGFAIFIIMCLLLGLTNGDKSMTITTLLCGIIALLWQRTRVSHVIWFVLFGMILLLVGLFLFDMDINDKSIWDALDYLRFRTFSLSAEGAWKIWELYIHDALVFNYPITLANIFGSGGIEFLFGVGKYDHNAYMFNFSRQVTALLYPEAIEVINLGEWNITPSAYVEGLVMGGIPGVILIGTFAGWLASRIKISIMYSVMRLNYAKASALIVYFVYGFLPWVQSGGITTLIHPITITGTLLSYYIIRVFERLVFHVPQDKLVHESNEA